MAKSNHRSSIIRSSIRLVPRGSRMNDDWRRQRFDADRVHLKHAEIRLRLSALLGEHDLEPHQHMVSERRAMQESELQEMRSTGEPFAARAAAARGELLNRHDAVPGLDAVDEDVGGHRREVEP